MNGNGNNISARESDPLRHCTGGWSLSADKLKVSNYLQIKQKCHVQDCLITHAANTKMSCVYKLIKLI